MKKNIVGELMKQMMLLNVVFGYMGGVILYQVDRILERDEYFAVMISVILNLVYDLISFYMINNLQI
jgi:hypothetical protein